MLRDVVSSQFRSVSLRILAKLTSPPLPSTCDQNRSKAVLRESPRMVSIRVCAVFIQWKQQQRHKSLYGVLVDRSEQNFSHSCMKRRVSPVMTDPFCGLPKLLLQSCHHLIHHLTCMLSFMLTNIGYQTLVNGIAHICHCQPASLDVQLKLRQFDFGRWRRAAVTFIATQFARACEVMPSHKCTNK